ncbi:helix-turn-helix domain-containing protein [Streptomyces sp. 6N223]|uniref:helix-turn-helix domain-containing protein n=1 Tax=Streptomyces sp. 6N223 TaxID=3457412 RepID=UPI003FCF615A
MGAGSSKKRGNGKATRQVPPTRQAYGEELRVRREAAGHTQLSLSELVICSPSLIAHWEAGRRKPSPEDAARLDEVLNTGGFFVRWLPTLDDGPVAAYFAQAQELEKQATTIQYYAATLVPGLLQTEEYARAVMRATRPTNTEAEIEERVASRMKRARILDDPAMPEYWAILDENVLRRQVGGPAGMARQLRHIASLIRSGRARVYVLPHAVGAHALLHGSVMLMEFDDQPTVAYVEGVMMGRVVDDPASIADYQRLYALVLGEALCSQQSLDLIEALAEEFEHAG